MDYDLHSQGVWVIKHHILDPTVAFSIKGQEEEVFV